MVCPALEEIIEDPREPIIEDLDALLREVDEARGRELQEGQEEIYHCSVVQSQPRVQSRAHAISWMVPGVRRGEQRATWSQFYIQGNSTRCPSTLQGPGEPGDQSSSPLASLSGTINSSLLWGASSISSSGPGQSGLVLEGEVLVWTPDGELGL